MSAAYGPWSPTATPEDRTKQLNTLVAVVHMQLGPQHPLIGELRRAETDRIAFRRAQELIEVLPPLHRRRLLATFQAITWPRGGAQ
jgi:hypothetical protein